MSKFRTLIVDDEGPARRKVRRFLEEEADFECVGEASDGADALAAIAETKPDLVFLDIHMAGMDGMQMVESLKVDPAPAIVFITAFDHYALKAFEVHAFDYLLKPFTQTRFREVLDRVRRYLSNAKEKPLPLPAELPPRFVEHLLVDLDDRSIFVQAADIEWIEAAKNYVVLHVGKQSYTVRDTLEGIATRLDPGKFFRVNRSRIVNIASIKELHPWFHGEYKILLKDGSETMWSRRYLDQAAHVLNRKKS